MLKFCLLSTYSNPFLGNVLNKLHVKGIEIDSVLLDSKCYTEKDFQIFSDRTANRWISQDLYAESLGQVPFFFVKSHDSEYTRNLLLSRKVDYCVNAGTPRILNKSFLAIPRFGVINVHPGLLPKYRGSCAVEWSILNDDPVGNTAHLMSEGIDEGPIFRTEIVDVSKTDRYEDIRIKVYERGLNLLANVVDDLYKGRLSNQDTIEQTSGSYFKPMNEQDHIIVKNKLNEIKYKYQVG